MVTYFQKRVKGPENRLEDAIVANINEFVYSNDPVWMAGSLKVGAGIPDLLCASFSPEVITLVKIDPSDINIMAYLHSVRCAKQETIASKTRHSETSIVYHLEKLIQLEIITSTTSSFSLTPGWRNILAEVVCVEAKVENWKTAVTQASRNLIFANRSFVALPEKTAVRVKDEPVFKKYGLGLLAVQRDDSIRVIRRARSSTPKVWFYYYQVARHLALDISR